MGKLVASRPGRPVPGGPGRDIWKKRFDSPLRETGNCPIYPADYFAPFAVGSVQRAFVVAQIGQSLDGRIATVSGESRDISGGGGLDHLHRLRANVDAVIVGAATVELDDPQLTVRRVAGRDPARVVIDPRGRLSHRSRWLAEDGVRRILVTCVDAPAPPGVERIRLTSQGGLIPPKSIVAALHACGLNKLLVEGGARTISSFLDSGCLDRLHVLIAPVIIGSGRTGLDLSPIERLDLALRPRAKAHVLDGGDVLIDCDFADIRQESIREL